MVRKDEEWILIMEVFPMSKLHPTRFTFPVNPEILNIKRKQTDAKAVLEVTDFCRKIDANDPAKFDFALFGYGVNEKKI